jgi:hypothetical protein
MSRRPHSLGKLVAPTWSVQEPWSPIWKCTNSGQFRLIILSLKYPLIVPEVVTGHRGRSKCPTTWWVIRWSSY